MYKYVLRYIKKKGVTELSLVLLSLPGIFTWVRKNMPQ